MDVRPRPDLSRILPRPWTRQLAEREPALGRSLHTPAKVPTEDYLVEVERRTAQDPHAAGFSLQQAIAVAQQVRQALGDRAAPPQREPDRSRAQHLLFDD